MAESLRIIFRPAYIVFILHHENTVSNIKYTELDFQLDLNLPSLF